MQSVGFSAAAACSGCPLHLPYPRPQHPPTSCSLCRPGSPLCLGDQEPTAEMVPTLPQAAPRRCGPEGSRSWAHDCPAALSSGGCGVSQTPPIPTIPCRKLSFIARSAEWLEGPGEAASWARAVPALPAHPREEGPHQPCCPWPVGGPEWAWRGWARQCVASRPGLGTACGTVSSGSLLPGLGWGY